MIEELSSAIHDWWMDWAKTIMKFEKLSEERSKRWESCFVPYADLSEEMKEKDREIARDFMKIMDLKLEGMKR